MCAPSYLTGGLYVSVHLRMVLEQVSFVNGICTTKGGNHVDHVASLVANGIIEDMAKKIKLKPQQVKNTFNIFVKATLENPTFSSQVKSECTSRSQDFGSKFDPPKNFVKNAPKDWDSR